MKGVSFNIGGTMYVTPARFNSNCNLELLIIHISLAQMSSSLDYALCQIPKCLIYLFCELWGKYFLHDNLMYERLNLSV